MPLHGAIVVGRVTTNFGGVDVVPLQGAIVMCYGWVDIFSSALITAKWVFAIWGLCWYNFVCLFDSLFVCLFVCLFVFLSVCLSVCLFLRV